MVLGVVINKFFWKDKMSKLFKSWCMLASIIIIGCLFYISYILSCLLVEGIGVYPMFKT